MKINNEELRMWKVGSILIAFSLLTLIALVGCTEQQTQSGYIDISAADARELITTEPDLIIIDVSPNYAIGHLPGAVNYYLGDGSLDDAIPTLDKTKPYLVYCHVDSVAISGAQKLVDAGFSTVYRLEGNYQAWVDAGFDTEP